MGSLKFCKKSQGWWRTRDWIDCMNEALGGKGGGRGKDYEMQ